MKFVDHLRKHWPEYLIEGWALGVFMISASLVTIVFESPGSAVHRAVLDSDLRRALVGVGMGATAVALIHSPWGRRSGAHMNPAMTLTYLRLGKIAPIDAMFYIAAQFIGGTLGVVLVWAILPAAMASPEVRFIVTVPGLGGEAAAFAAETLIAGLLILVILQVSNSAHFSHYTGLCAGVLIAAYISIEAPLSGMSINPARSFASALPSGIWTGFWIYVIAPVLGMQAGAGAFGLLPGGVARCAKLLHSDRQRCIHCGYLPPGAAI